MDWVRYQLGITEAPKAAKKPHAALERHMSDTTPHDQRTANLELAMTRQVGMLNAQLADLQETIAASPAGSAAMRQALVDKQRVTKELVAAQNKLANVRAQRNVTTTAAANIEHALLVKQGADELESIQTAMEQLDTESDVDRIREAADELKAHDDTLATPIFGDVVDDDDVEAQMAAIQAEREEREAAERLLGASAPPQGAQTTPTRVPTTPSTPAREGISKEN